MYENIYTQKEKNTNSQCTKKVRGVSIPIDTKETTIMNALSPRGLNYILMVKSH
jgi:hypothetical protein